MAFDEKKFVGTDALSELSTKVKTELDKKTDKAGALTNVSYDTTNKKFTKTTQGAHDPVTTDIVSTSTLKTDMGIADFDGTFNSLKNKPTTISGYGITDAKVQNSTVTIGSNSVTALTQDDVSSTYDSSGTSPVDGKAIAAALGTLDVESVGGAGKYISAISETDGKISATAETMDSTPTSNSTKAVTSDGIYEYVNSSVATNTAYFIGTFDSVEELEAYSGIITNNDYAFVTSTDSSGNTLYNRYKYNGSTHTWAFEYALNNSSFTSAQWATIQSGLTSSDKTKLDGIQSGANKTIVDAAMSSSSTNPVQNKVLNTALAGKQDTLTFDSTPTQSSTNPVTSAGIYTDQVRQDALEAQDRAALIEVVDGGAKNLANFANYTKSTPAITIAENGGVVTINGTPTSVCSVYTMVSLPSGTYSISGCPSGGGESTYQIDLRTSAGSTIQGTADTGNGSVFTVQEGIYRLNIRVAANYVCNNLVFNPMICTKASFDISPNFESYMASDSTVIDATRIQTNNGYKNELIFDGLSTSLNQGVSFTLNSDGTVTVKRESTGTSNAISILKFEESYKRINEFCDGTYILSGCPEGGNSSEFELMATVSGGAYTKRDYGGGVLLDATDTTSLIYVEIMVRSGFTGTVTFKPMICKKSLYDISAAYEPYALPNPPITAKMIEDVDDGTKNIVNLLQTTFTTNTKDGVTVTRSGDTFTITGIGGTSSNNFFNLYYTPNTVLIPSGTWIFALVGTGLDNIRLEVSDDVSSDVQKSSYGENPFICTVPSGVTKSHFRICTKAGANFNNSNTSFKIMICSPEDWNISHKYVPYKQDITWGLGDKIPQNSDFNSYTIPGVYRVENSTDAATMLHCPITTDGGRLEVSVGDTSTEILHTYFSGNTEWRRSYNGTTWSNWVQILSTATLDEIPTANSTNAVMSGGVWTDQQRQETEIGVVANAGAKSLLPIGVSSITYYSAVTFSVADDGQITVNGTNPNTNNGIVYQDIVTAKTNQTETRYTLPVGTYKITGTGTNGLRFQVHCHDGTNTHELFSKSSDGEFSYTESLKSQYPYICWRILIVAKSSFSNHVVKPMIWDAAITDPTFQPYAKTNRELTVENASQQSEINYAINAGAKNLLNFDAWKDVGVTRCTKTISGNSITITSTDNDSFTWYIAESTTVQYPVAARIPVEAGKTYRLSWTASNNNKLNHAIYGNGTTGRPDNTVYRGEGSGYLDYTAASDVTFITFRLGLYDSGKTTTFSNVMIRPAAITDPTFQPYALPNPTLTPAVIKAVDEGAKNLLSENSGSGVRYWQIPVSLPVGTYVVYFGGISSTDTDSTTSQFGAFAADNSLSAAAFQMQRQTNQYNVFSTEKETAYVRFYASDNYAHGADDTVTVTNAMICTAADWAISQTFQPYRPSWQEMYEMIQALQNGGNRALTMQTEPEEQEER